MICTSFAQCPWVRCCRLFHTTSPPPSDSPVSTQLTSRCAPIARQCIGSIFTYAASPQSQSSSLYAKFLVCRCSSCLLGRSGWRTGRHYTKHFLPVVRSYLWHCIMFVTKAERPIEPPGHHVCGCLLVASLTLLGIVESGVLRKQTPFLCPGLWRSTDMGIHLMHRRLLWAINRAFQSEGQCLIREPVHAHTQRTT